MDAIHFQAEGGSDDPIRVPDGIRLPAGPLEVTVVPCAKPADLACDLATTRGCSMWRPRRSAIPRLCRLTWLQITITTPMESHVNERSLC